MSRWWRRTRPGWVCDFGVNHYMDGCAQHRCLNRDGVIKPNPRWQKPTMQAHLEGLARRVRANAE